MLAWHMQAGRQTPKPVAPRPCLSRQARSIGPSELAAHPAKDPWILCRILLVNHCSFQSLSQLAPDFLFTRTRFTDRGPGLVGGLND
eukprot:COSAG01_NODE_4078_length_5377_cov_48.766578_5_plen_87_part_00